jgi:Tat protein secretion system quality control protein TatD with DNase activity
MLLAVGIPLVAFFIQVDGAVRFSKQDKIFERTLTAAEKQEIRAAIDARKARLDTIQRIIEEIKERYRNETGESYQRDAWVVHVKDGLAIPYRYVLALGALLFLVGIGKLVV